MDNLKQCNCRRLSRSQSIHFSKTKVALLHSPTDVAGIALQITAAAEVLNQHLVLERGGDRVEHEPAIITEGHIAEGLDGAPRDLVNAVLVARVVLQSPCGWHALPA